MKIVKGKTEGEHQAESQRNISSNKATSSNKTEGSGKKLSERDINQVQEAMKEFEEIKGDFAKDH
jgi:hypothetical protein